MAAISTAPTALDKKLHRIILDSDSDQYATMSALARYVEQNEYLEFSYTRDNETHFSSASTIFRYVSYAKTIGLLNDKLASSRSKRDVRSLEEFQQWLSESVVKYLEDNSCSVDSIRDAAQALLQKFPSKLPTPANVHAHLKIPLVPEVFRMSLRIVSLLRPKVFQLKSRQVILVPKSVEG